MRYGVRRHGWATKVDFGCNLKQIWFLHLVLTVIIFHTFRSTNSLIPDFSGAVSRDRAVLPSQSNCSSGSSRVGELVREEGGVLQNNVFPTYPATNGQDLQERSIDRGPVDSVFGAQSIQAGSWEPLANDACGEATSKWKRRLA